MALNGQEALRSKPYDVVLMDIQRETTDAGLQATEKIKDIEEVADIRPIPIICCSTFLERTKKDIFEKGMTGSMPKPFSLI